MPAPSFPRFDSAAAVWPCCLGPGECISGDESICRLGGGTPYPGCTCDEVLCADGPTLACCFPETAECKQLTPNECAAQGGVPMGPGTCCTSVDNCSAFRTGACCFDDQTCEVLSEDECATLLGQFHIGQPCEAVACDIPLPRGACCLPNDAGDCFYETEAMCNMRRGQWHENKACEEIQCKPPPFPRGCRPERTQHYVDREWSLDLCSHYPAMLTIRPESMYPIAGTPEAEAFQPGMFEFVSLWPIRALERNLAAWRGDVCAHHFSRMHLIDSTGMFSGVACSRPLRSESDSEQSQLMPIYVQEKPDQTQLPVPMQSEQVPEGTMMALGTYHAPFWTEGVLDSHVETCVCIN